VVLAARDVRPRDGVEDYPRFLPWCDRAEVLEQHDDGMTARLGLAYMGVRHAFTTRNHTWPGERWSCGWSTARSRCSTAPGCSTRWVRPGSEAPACKIEFDLRYAFSSKALETVVSPVFDRVANTFVDSFVKRAEEVYGPR
jgi:ribosome-associated toxin RatA of RatAB toxin-antitoxin module